MTEPQPRPRGHLLVLGTGPIAPGALAEMAMRLASVAHAMRFDRVKVTVSRVPGSSTRSLSIDDARGRTWKIRLSSHRRPTDAPTPHLDLVSLDGVTGFDQVVVFLRRIADDQAEWFDESSTGRMISQLQRKRWGRR